MATDKGETAAAQVDAAKTAAKKPKKGGDSKKASSMTKVVAEAKALYSDLDQSEGRKMRKRKHVPAPLPAKKAKKTGGAKKTAAPKKAAAKKGATDAKSE